MEQENRPTAPTDDVDYDEEALREAEKKMHAEGSGQDPDQGVVRDPEGDHDPDALEEAARRMGTEK